MTLFSQFRRSAVVAMALLLNSLLAHAQVSVTDAWVRATVPVQKSSGAFLQLLASEPARLVAVQAQGAEIAEIHESRTINDVMRMRRIEKLDLVPGKALIFAPGGYHIMLMGLAKQLKAGETVDITLQFEGADKPFAVKVKAQVRPFDGSSPKDDHLHKHKHEHK